MPAFLGGLPLHPLVVHAVVVLVPLAALGTLAIALVPALRRRYGWLVVGVTAVATAAVPLATSTGEGLERTVPPSAAVERHTQLGDQLLPFVLGLLAAVVLLMVVHAVRDRAARGEGPGAAAAPPPHARLHRLLVTVLAGLAVVAAVTSAVQVVRIGDAGARAVWGQQHDQQRGGGGADGN